ncbi:MAG: ATP synthase F1 subunit gamma [Buchnera aphidicola (Meitanaphis microgallis)]
MSKIKEVRNKINCIKNTQKITKAMEMVSISKMKKAEIKMNSGRPYLKIITNIINSIMHNHTKYYHLYLNKKVIKQIGIIIISTDQGLCGNLNTMLFKNIVELINFYKNKNIASNLFILGSKGLSFFRSFSGNIVYFKNNLKNNYTFFKCLDFINASLKSYNIENIDKLFLAYNQFKNTFTRIPLIIKLLPLSKEKISANNNERWDYIYESNSHLLLDKLLKKYVKFQIYQAILENYACEQTARMIAMKQATDNSKDLIEQLQTIYNKIRQGNITQELTEIISGATTVSLN